MPPIPVQIWVDKDDLEVRTNRHRIKVRTMGPTERTVRWKLVGSLKQHYLFYFEMKQGKPWPFVEERPTEQDPVAVFESGYAKEAAGEYPFAIHVVPQSGADPADPLDPDIVIDDRGGLLPIDDDFWLDLADRIKGIEALQALRLQEEDGDCC